MSSYKVQAAIILAFVVISGIFVQYVYSRGPVEPNIEMEVEDVPQNVAPSKDYTFKVRARSNPADDFKIFVYNNFYEDVDSDNVLKKYPVRLTENMKTIQITIHIPSRAAYVGSSIKVQLRDNKGMKIYREHITDADF